MKKIKILTLALVAALSLNSCLVDDETPSQDLISTPNVVEFDKNFVLYSYDTAETADQNETVYVNRKGGSNGATNTPLSFTVSVDPASSAVAGTDYVLTSDVINLEAGRDNFALPIVVKTANLSTTESKTIILKIVPTDNVVTSEQFNSEILVLLAKCTSALHTNTYDVNITRNSSGNVVARGTESITEITPGNFRTATSGHWTAAQLGVTADKAGFFFSDVCGIIYVDTQNLAQTYSNLVEGTVVDPLTQAHGSVDAMGNITINYTVTPGASSDRDYTAVYTKL